MLILLTWLHPILMSTDEVDGGEYKPLPWKATKAQTKQWLVVQGYSSCADSLEGYTGSQLYQLSREKLRELCGFSEGVRLFSQLQRDKKQVLYHAHEFPSQHAQCMLALYSKT